jgi:hypothetical protein
MQKCMHCIFWLLFISLKHHMTYVRCMPCFSLQKLSLETVSTQMDIHRTIFEKGIVVQVCLHEKYPWFLSDFTQNWDVSNKFLYSSPVSWHENPFSTLSLSKVGQICQANKCISVVFSCKWTKNQTSDWQLCCSTGSHVNKLVSVSPCCEICMLPFMKALNC